jgi:CubicO group peptidase (beta-lactamase class C family)
MNDVVHGHCDARFDKVADALAEEITKGEELGAAIAIDIDGEPVVDVWGGFGGSMIVMNPDRRTDDDSCAETWR